MIIRQQPSIETLSSLIAHIHDAALDEDRWPSLLARIGSLFHSPSVTVWKQTASGEFRDIYTCGEDDKITHDYAINFSHLDKLRPAVMREAAGTVLTNNMVVDPRDFTRSEFYCDFVARHRLADCLQGRVFEGAHISGYIGVTGASSAGMFEVEDVRLLSLLLPHLGCAMEVQRRLINLGVERNSALEALDLLRDGVFLVDAQARVVHANQIAEALLRKGDRLAVDQGSKQLRVSGANETVSLRRFIATTAALRQAATFSPEKKVDGALRLDCGESGVLLLRAVPLQADSVWNMPSNAAVLLLVTCLEGEEAEHLQRHMRALFNLTPAEATVARLIGQAKGVNTSAAAMRITPATLRWHLQRVFEKTGTTRQAELTRLVERLGSFTDRVRDPEG